MPRLHPNARILLLAMCSLATLCRADEPAPLRLGAPSHPETLGSTFVAWDSLAAKPTGVGTIRPVFDNPTPGLAKLELHVTTLLPGKSSHPPHRHPWEEMLFIKEGAIEVSLHGKPVTAAAGSLAFFASDDPHNATNAGDVPATYYVINFVSERVKDFDAAPGSVPQGADLVPSSVFDIGALPSTPNATGSRVNVVDQPTRSFGKLSVHTTTLDPGKATAAGMVDEGNELFIVRSGILEATVNGVSARLREGSFFYAAPNDRRSLRNLGDTPATYLVIKVVSGPERASK